MPLDSLHGWSRLKYVVATQFVLTTSILMSAVNAGQITTTIHSTHAYVNLAPEFCCGGTIFGGCGRQYDARTMSTYTLANGKKHTFHQTQSVDNDLEHRNLTRHVSIPFKGTSVYLYMAPRRFLHYPPGDQEVCINGACHSVNATGRYEAAGDTDEPVLLWWAENLDQDYGTLLELRLVDRNCTRSMSFQYLKYTWDVRYRIPPPLSKGLQLINATLHDTHYAMGYTPATSHSECCGGDYNPWYKRLFSSSSRASDTFHHTSSGGSEPFGDRIRQVSFAFQSAAVYLYGPPPQALEEIWGDELVHGRQEVCINNQCDGLDVHQTYLNIDIFNKNDPVLLWSFELFSPNTHTHSIFDSFTPDHPMRFRLRLLDPDSPVRESQLVFDRAVVSEIHSLPRWHHPLPNGRYSSTTIGFGSVKYTPDPTAWTGVAVGTSNVAMQAFDVLSEDVMPGWQHEFIGHDIKVFGAPRVHMENIQHATQMICVDAACHYVDVEQVYLTIDTWDYGKPVLLLRLSDLDPYTKHTVSVVAVRKDGDSAKPRVMTFQSLEYETFTPVIRTFTPVIPTSTSAIPTSTPAIPTLTPAIPRPKLPSPKHPSQPTMPSPEYPSSDSDSFSASVFLVMFVVLLAFIAASFTYFLNLAIGNCTKVQRTSRETEPFIRDRAPWCPPAPPPRPTYHTPPAPRFPPPYTITTEDGDWVETRAIFARNRRPDPPWASPHPALYSSRQPAEAPTEPVVRAYGATNQHVPPQSLQGPRH